MVFWESEGILGILRLGNRWWEGSRNISVGRVGVYLGVNYIVRSENEPKRTSFSPKSSPTLLCRIAPDETRVTILPDPEDVGCGGSVALLGFCGVTGVGGGVLVTVPLTVGISTGALTATV